MDKLVVFRKVWEYLFWLRPTVERFARVHRYGLGSETEAGAMRLLRLVVKANYSSETKPVLIREAIIEYEIQRVYLRLAFEYRLVSQRQFEHASERLEEIARLLRGWLKKTTA